MSPGTGVTDVGARVDLDALHQASWRPMVRLAYLLVDDVALAEDVVQDAFLALYRRATTLRDVEAAHGYVRTAVVNGARSTLRRRRTVRGYLRSVRLEHEEPADHDLLVTERDAALHAALERLPRRQREVVVLRYLGAPVRGGDRQHPRHRAGDREVDREPRAHRARRCDGGPPMTTPVNDDLDRELEAALTRLATRAVPDDGRVPAPPWATEPARRGAADLRRFGRATPWLVAAVLLVVAGLGVGATVAFDASAPDRTPVGTEQPSPTATTTSSDGTLGDPPTVGATPSSRPSLDRNGNVGPSQDASATETATRTVGVGTYGPVSAGMTQAAALTALGLTAADVAAGPNSCFRYLPLTGSRTVDGSSGLSDLVVVDTATDRVVLVTPPSTARDAAGLGVGTTLARLRSAYPDGTVVHSVSGYVFVRFGSGDTGTGYALSTDLGAPDTAVADTDTVQGFLVGNRDHAQGFELYCTTPN